MSSLLTLTRAAPPNGRRWSLPWHRSPPLPDGALPETIDAGKARDALHIHGYSDLAVALLLPADACAARRRGKSLLVAAARMGAAGAAGAAGGDYRRALGAAPITDVADVAHAGAWLLACGRVGHSVRANLADAGVTPQDTPAAADVQGLAPRPSRIEGSASAAPSLGNDALDTPPSGDQAPGHEATRPVGSAGAASPDTPDADLRNERTGASTPTRLPVYVADPAHFFVSDPTPGGEEDTSPPAIERPEQIPTYFMGWLEDDRTTGTGGRGCAP